MKRIGLLAGWCCLALSAQAASLRISPIGLDLPSNQRAGSMTLVNTGGEPVNLQMRVFQWTQDAGEDVLTPTTALTVSPPAATIPPGASYTIRVARPAAAPVEGEQSYRLLIDELPKPIDPRTVDQGVSMVLRTSMPVFIAHPKAMAQLAWRVWRDGQGLHAEVANQGNRHAKITGLSVQTSTGQTLAFGQGLNGYVLAGSRKRFDLPADTVPALGAGEPLKLTGNNGPLVIDETLHLEAR